MVGQLISDEAWLLTIKLIQLGLGFGSVFPAEAYVLRILQSRP
jgi:hypothetical protein